MLDKIEAVRQGGSVKRYHTERIIGDDLVSSHSWGVATLIALLHPSPSAGLLQAALFHDVGEKCGGDSPHTAKQRFPELRKILHQLEREVLERLGLLHHHQVLTDEERHWLKTCDMLELVLFCREQMLYGNSHARGPYQTGVTFLNSYSNLPEPVHAVFTALLARDYAVERTTKGLE